MKTTIMVGTERVKAMAKGFVPEVTRRWIRGRQRSAFKKLIMKKQSFKDRVIIRKQHITNQEGFLNFDFTLSARHRRQGVSAMLRVKNEEEKIYYCLKSIIEVFDEIVLVDNGSEDKTMEVIRRFKSQEDQRSKINIYFYPFKIARYGREHFNTPEDSVCSMAYYSNWTVSKCSFKYVCRWDADMILRQEAREPLERFLQQIQKTNQGKCWQLNGQTVYRDLSNNYYLSKEEINQEIRIFPYGFNPRWYKADLYEVIQARPSTPRETFGGVSFYELKFVNEDEFSHWSTNDVPPTPRKKREWENFYRIKRGDIDSVRFEKLPSGFLDAEVS